MKASALVTAQKHRALPFTSWVCVQMFPSRLIVIKAVQQMTNNTNMTDN